MDFLWGISTFSKWGSGCEIVFPKKTTQNTQTKQIIHPTHPKLALVFDTYSILF